MFPGMFPGMFPQIAKTFFSPAYSRRDLGMKRLKNPGEDRFGLAPTWTCTILRRCCPPMGEKAWSRRVRMHQDRAELDADAAGTMEGVGGAAEGAAGTAATAAAPAARGALPYFSEGANKKTYLAA
jgi:hypothetical protein